MYRFHWWLAAAMLVAGSAGLSLAADAASSPGVDLKALDTNAKPCQNFYQYACGGWRKNNPAPPDQSRWGRFNELAERNLTIERAILEKTENRQLADYYAACMDETAIERKGIQPIMPMLQAIDALPSKQGLANEVARLQDAGIRVLFSLRVQPDQKKADQEIANLDQGGLGLPDRDYYLKTDAHSVELRKQYVEHIRAMFALLAKAEGTSDANAEAHARVAMKIETVLAQASMDRVSRRNPHKVYHIMTDAQLVELAPDFAWKQYLSVVGIPAVPSLNVAVPDFIKALNGTIADSSLADLKTYLRWHVLLAAADLLPHEFEDEDFHFYEHILRGTKEMPPRWKRCTRSTDRALGEALGREFVKTAFGGASKQKALELVGEIEREMGKDIQSAAWMTPATKEQALAKLRAVANKIGYPEKWRDYSSVKIARDDYFGDEVRAREFEIQRNFHKIGKPVDKAEWNMTPPTVNAYYSPPMNNINFPAGILQPPFYNPQAPEAVNYGAIGTVVGHELTHGFDDEGRKYDGAGNVRDWWTPEDAKAFESRADCIANEYGNFSPVEGVKLNGKLTLGENSADNGGIRLAYMALLDRLRAHTEPRLGLVDGFTPQQQFFLGYAHMWCENATEESSRVRAATDPHSPGKFRVNGVLQNMPEFGEAFACKAGEPMVAEQPCRVW